MFDTTRGWLLTVEICFLHRIAVDAVDAVPLSFDLVWLILVIFISCSEKVLALETLSVIWSLLIRNLVLLGHK